MADIVREIPGPVGPRECLVEVAAWASPAFVVFAHPRPTEGDAMHTQVVFKSAKARARIKCPVLRCNFRGVGVSAGEWDTGVGPGVSRR